jgi:hypothetical protein
MAVPDAEAVTYELWRLLLSTATLPPFDRSNSYVIAGSGEGLLVDAGSDAQIASTLIAMKGGRISLRDKAYHLFIFRAPKARCPNAFARQAAWLELSGTIPVTRSRRRRQIRSERRR